MGCEQAAAQFFASAQQAPIRRQDSSPSQLDDRLREAKILERCAIDDETRVEACAFVQDGAVRGATVLLQPANQPLGNCVADAIRGVPLPSSESPRAYRLLLEVGPEPPAPLPAPQGAHWTRDTPLPLAQITGFDCKIGNEAEETSLSVASHELPKRFAASVAWFDQPLRCQLEFEFGCLGSASAWVSLGRFGRWAELPILVAPGGMRAGKLDSDEPGRAGVRFEIPADVWHAGLVGRGQRQGKDEASLVASIELTGQCADRTGKSRRFSASEALSVRFSGVDFDAVGLKPDQAVALEFGHHIAAFHECYDSEFAGQDQPELDARVQGFFANDGTFREVKVKGSAADHEGLKQCLLRVARSIRVPLGLEPVSVDYPLHFVR